MPYFFKNQIPEIQNILTIYFGKHLGELIFEFCPIFENLLFIETITPSIYHAFRNRFRYSFCGHILWNIQPYTIINKSKKIMMCEEDGITYNYICMDDGLLNGEYKM